MMVMVVDSSIDYRYAIHSPISIKATKIDDVNYVDSGRIPRGRCLSDSELNSFAWTSKFVIVRIYILIRIIWFAHNLLIASMNCRRSNTTIHPQQQQMIRRNVNWFLIECPAATTTNTTALHSHGQYAMQPLNGTNILFGMGYILQPHPHSNSVHKVANLITTVRIYCSGRLLPGYNPRIQECMLLV